MESDNDLYNELRQLFDTLCEGERIPSERALAERFGVSRATIKRVLLQLGSEGMLSLAPGHCPRIAKRAGVPMALERLLKIEPALEQELGEFVRSLKMGNETGYPVAVQSALERLEEIADQ